VALLHRPTLLRRRPLIPAQVLKITVLDPPPHRLPARSPPPLLQQTAQIQQPIPRRKYSLRASPRALLPDMRHLARILSCPNPVTYRTRPLTSRAAAPRSAAPPCASTISPQTIPSQLSSYKSRTLPHDFHNLPTLPIFKPKISHGRQQVASSKLVLRCNESARHHFRTPIPFSRTSRVCLRLYVYRVL
jgi:hypothetical protein